MSDAVARHSAGTGFHGVVPYRPTQLHAAVELWQQFVLSLDRLSGSSVFSEANRLIRDRDPVKRLG